MKSALRARPVRIAVALLVAGGALGAGAVSAPTPAVFDPIAAYVRGGLLDEVPVVQPAVAGAAPVMIPAAAQIDAWLGEYAAAGALAAYRSGELRIRVGDTLVTPDHGGVAGTFVGAGGILISATAGWGPWVLTHEVGHWLQAKDITVRQEGLATAIPAFERDADCIAVVLLAGTPDAAKVTDCRKDEIDLAVNVIAGRPLGPVSPEASSASSSVKAAGASPYAGSAVDLKHTFPTAAYVLAARARAGVTTGAKGLVDIAAGASTLTLAAARAADPEGADTGWARDVGVAILEVPDLRLTWGADMLDIDGAIAVDRDRVPDAASVMPRAIAERVAARVPGIDSCWAPMLALVGEGFVDADQWGVYSAGGTPDSLGLDCTRAQLLRDASLWAASPFARHPVVEPRGDQVLTDGVWGFVPVTDPNRVATFGDWLDAQGAAGLGDPRAGQDFSS